MVNGSSSNDNINTKAYYESMIEELKTNKKDNFKLSLDQINELAESIVNTLWSNHELINMEDSYDIVFNKIHEKYGI